MLCAKIGVETIRYCFPLKSYQKMAFFLLYYVAFAVQSESKILFFCGRTYKYVFLLFLMFFFFLVCLFG